MSDEEFTKKLNSQIHIILEKRLNESDERISELEKSDKYLNSSREFLKDKFYREIAELREKFDIIIDTDIPANIITFKDFQQQLTELKEKLVTNRKLDGHVLQKNLDELREVLQELGCYIGDFMRIKVNKDTWESQIKLSEILAKLDSQGKDCTKCNQVRECDNTGTLICDEYCEETEKKEVDLLEEIREKETVKKESLKKTLEDTIEVFDKYDKKDSGGEKEVGERSVSSIPHETPVKGKLLKENDLLDSKPPEPIMDLKHIHLQEREMNFEPYEFVSEDDMIKYWRTRGYIVVKREDLQFLLDHFDWQLGLSRWPS